MGGEKVELYCDTGSNITIITPDMYEKGIGKEVAARSHLRAWGSDKYLDTKGMFKTTLTTSSGTTKRTWGYVVGGGKAGVAPGGPLRKGPGDHQLPPRRVPTLRI